MITVLAVAAVFAVLFIAVCVKEYRKRHIRNGEWEEYP